MKGFRVYDEYVEKYVTNEFCWLVDSDGEIKSLENGNLISYPHCIKEDETGLTDKNGKKIFEGDIVDVFDIWCGGKYKVVWWEDASFRLTQNDRTYLCLDTALEKGCKVIGNIHDKCFVEKTKGGEIK